MTTIEINKISADNKKPQKVSISVPYENIKLNNDLVTQILNSYLANKRVANSHTKTRSYVSGTGKKPYKQKGTGYARFGSLRTPIHRGGGVAFGPKNTKNYHQKISKKLKKKAIAIILNEKCNNDLVSCIPNIDIKKPNTKEVLKTIASYSLKDGDALILTETNQKNLHLSLRNVPYINVKTADNLNALDLLTHDNIIFTGESYKTLFDKKSVKLEKKQ